MKKRLSTNQKAIKAYVSGYQVGEADLQRHGRERASRNADAHVSLGDNPHWCDGYRHAVLGISAIYTVLDFDWMK